MQRQGWRLQARFADTWAGSRVRAIALGEEPTVVGVPVALTGGGLKLPPDGVAGVVHPQWCPWLCLYSECTRSREEGWAGASALQTPPPAERVAGGGCETWLPGVGSGEGSQHRCEGTEMKFIRFCSQSVFFLVPQLPPTWRSSVYPHVWIDVMNATQSVLPNSQTACPRCPGGTVINLY